MGTGCTIVRVLRTCQASHIFLNSLCPLTTSTVSSRSVNWHASSVSPSPAICDCEGGAPPHFSSSLARSLKSLITTQEPLIPPPVFGAVATTPYICVVVGGHNICFETPDQEVPKLFCHCLRSTPGREWMDLHPEQACINIHLLWFVTPCSLCVIRRLLLNIHGPPLMTLCMSTS